MPLSPLLNLLIGGALGDAYGGVYEGQRNPEPGDQISHFAVSDDTQLTLATCEALSAKRSELPASISQAMLRWYHAGQLSGLGASTTKALQELSMGGHWALVGRRGEHAAGNGAAMRIAPLAFLEPELDRQTLRDVCRITHHSEEAYVGALAIFLAVRKWREAFSDSRLLPFLIDELPDTQVRDRMVALVEAKGLSIEELGKRFGSSGYVVDSVPLALCATQSSRGTSTSTAPIFAELVRAGGDTDTNCFLAGQLIGLCYGQKAFPAAWLTQLQNHRIYPALLAVAKLR